MSEYHKIQTAFKRDPENNHKTLLEGEFSLPEFEFLADNIWTFTEKVDGTNIRIYSTPEGTSISGRTDRAQIPPFLLDALKPITDRMEIEHTMIFGSADVVLYGEGYGPKIQKHGDLYRDDASFVLFDVRVGDWWLRRNDVTDVAAKLDVEDVPIIGEGSLWDMVECAKQGFDSQWGSFQAEGIVARPDVELLTRSGHRIITKIKCKDFA